MNKYTLNNNQIPQPEYKKSKLFQQIYNTMTLYKEESNHNKKITLAYRKKRGYSLHCTLVIILRLDTLSYFSSPTRKNFIDFIG